MRINLQSLINKKTLIISFLILLTILLRFYNLEQTFSFHAEYNYKLWAIKEVAFDHKLRLIGIEAVSYLHHLHYPPLALYIFAIPLLLSQGNPLSIEIFLILINGLNVVIIFLLGLNLGGKKFAFFSAVIYSCSFYVQRHDRFIWVVGPIITFCLLYFLLIKNLEDSSEKKHIKTFALGLLSGLALSFHFQAFLFLPLTFIYFLIKKEKIANYFIFLTGYIAFLIPILIFELRHNFYNLQGILLLINDSSSIAKSSFINTLILTASTIGNLPIQIVLPKVSLPQYIYLVSFFVQISLALKILIKSKFYKIQHFFVVLFLITTISYPFVQNKYYSVDYYLIILIPIYIYALAYLFVKIFKKFLYIAILLTVFVYINMNQSIGLKQSLPYYDQKKAFEWVIQNSPKNHFEIKFQDYKSEEFDFLIYYLATKNNYPYKNIHYIDPWQTSEQPQFIVSNSQLQNSKRFGKIYITKK